MEQKTFYRYLKDEWKDHNTEHRIRVDLAEDGKDLIIDITPARFVGLDNEKQNTRRYQIPVTGYAKIKL